MNRRLVLHGINQLAALGLDFPTQQSERLASAVNRALLALHRLGERLVQHDDGGERGARDQEIRFELAEGVARLERVD